MPTKKPRIAVLLEPETYETVRQLAAVNSVSVSRFVGEIIEGLSEPFGVMLEFHRKIDEMDVQTRRGLLEGFKFANDFMDQAFANALASEGFELGPGAGRKQQRDKPPSCNTGAKT